MKKHNQIIAIIICVLYVFSIFLSSSFIAHNEGHECSGAECEICAQVESCQENLKSITLSTPIMVVTFVLVAFTLIKDILNIFNYVKRDTPYILKVKLRI